MNSSALSSTTRKFWATGPAAPSTTGMKTVVGCSSLLRRRSRWVPLVTCLLSAKSWRRCRTCAVSLLQIIISFSNLMKSKIWDKKLSISKRPESTTTTTAKKFCLHMSQKGFWKIPKTCKSKKSKIATSQCCKMLHRKTEIRNRTCTRTHCNYLTCLPLKTTV